MTTGLLCLGQLKSRPSAFELVHSKMAASFERKLTSTVEFLEWQFPLEHKKLLFMFRIIIMPMILTSLVHELGFTERSAILNLQEQKKSNSTYNEQLSVHKI